MNFLEKLDFLMGEREINKNVLSIESGIPYTTIDGFYKKGYENTKLSTIKKLAGYFDTTLDYLMNDNITDPNFGKGWEFKVDYDEMNHIKKYRSLDTHGQQAVNSILEVELERMQEQENNKVVEIRKKYPIQEYEERVSAGTGNNLDYASAFITELDYEPPKCADFIVRVAGDSMTPTYNDGDRLFIHRTKDFNYGDIGIFFVPQDGLVVKEYTTDGLISRNKDYKVIKATDGIEYIGKVIGKVK